MLVAFGNAKKPEERRPASNTERVVVGELVEAATLLTLTEMEKIKRSPPSSRSLHCVCVCDSKNLCKTRPRVLHTHANR